MTLPSTTRRPSLDPGTFGASPAAHILVEKINARGDAAIARRLVKTIQQYTDGLGEMTKLNDPPRTLTMKWWYAEHLAMGRPDELEQIGMLSYFNNVLQARLRQFLDQGKVLEVLRDRDPDYGVIADELRQMRLSQDRD